MTFTLANLSTRTPISSLPPIHTANGIKMSITHVGDATTYNLYLPYTYFVPNLALNLISVGQLCDLGLNILFSSYGCQVMDPQTGQILRSGRKVGRLFELVSLRLPSKLISTATTPIFPLHQWHHRLGHVSTSKLSPLVSHDILSRAGITDSKIVSTPLELNAKLVPTDGVPLDDPTLDC
ncbi:hypothetical protein L6164_021028 [Bauhinia variegata]|uniref:Uncharacterized protein n=1 Tax=Bauhinia variegata TaxID=167791 RepID=A0ACB9MWV2_BAUVA|nr:hypothetical protein L6164_021028 [Bauhinia variegata]